MADAVLAPKSPAESETVISALIMPADANNHHTAFGGVILKMIDQAAGVAAQRHARNLCVTVSVDAIDFREPIQLGELVTCRARVHYVGRTSLLIGVQVVAENLNTGVRRFTNDCFLTFVSVGPDGRPVPVPPLKVETPEDRQRYEEGRRRREANERLRRELGER